MTMHAKNEPFRSGFVLVHRPLCPYSSYGPVNSSTFLEGGAGVLGAAVDDDTVKDVTSAVGSVAGEVAKTAKKNKENN